MKLKNQQIPSYWEITQPRLLIFFKGDNTRIIKNDNKVFFNTKTNIGAWKILFVEYDSVNAIRF